MLSEGSQLSLLPAQKLELICVELCNLTPNTDTTPQYQKTFTIITWETLTISSCSEQILVNLTVSREFNGFTYDCENNQIVK